jgi:hypothetical protein
MLSTAARATRRMTWLALVGGAAWLPVGLVIAAGFLLTTVTLSDAISGGDRHDKAMLIRAVADLSAQAEPDLRPVLRRVP